MSGSVKEWSLTILAAVYGPPFIALTFIVANLLLVTFFTNKCKKCILRVRCSEECKSKTKRDSIKEIISNIYDLDLIAALIIGVIELIWIGYYIGKLII